MSDMCKWWRDGETVLPQLTFKGGGSPAAAVHGARDSSCGAAHDRWIGGVTWIHSADADSGGVIATISDDCRCPVHRWRVSSGAACISPLNSVLPCGRCLRRKCQAQETCRRDWWTSSPCAGAHAKEF
jgi:hypothetical protein